MWIILGISPLQRRDQAHQMSKTAPELPCVVDRLPSRAANSCRQSRLGLDAADVAHSRSACSSVRAQCNSPPAAAQTVTFVKAVAGGVGAGARDGRRDVFQNARCTPVARVVVGQHVAGRHLDLPRRPSRALSQRDIAVLNYLRAQQLWLSQLATSMQGHDLSAATARPGTMPSCLRPWAWSGLVQCACERPQLAR